MQKWVWNFLRQASMDGIAWAGMGWEESSEISLKGQQNRVRHSDHGESQWRWKTHCSVLDRRVIWPDIYELWVAGYCGWCFESKFSEGNGKSKVVTQAATVIIQERENGGSYQEGMIQKYFQDKTFMVWWWIGITQESRQWWLRGCVALDSSLEEWIYYFLRWQRLWTKDVLGRWAGWWKFIKVSIRRTVFLIFLSYIQDSWGIRKNYSKIIKCFSLPLWCARLWFSSTFLIDTWKFSHLSYLTVYNG